MLVSEVFFSPKKKKPRLYVTWFKKHRGLKFFPVLWLIWLKWILELIFLFHIISEVRYSCRTSIPHWMDQILTHWNCGEPLSWAKCTSPWAVWFISAKWPKLANSFSTSLQVHHKCPLLYESTVPVWAPWKCAWHREAKTRHEPAWIPMSYYWERRQQSLGTKAFYKIICEWLKDGSCKRQSNWNHFQIIVMNGPRLYWGNRGVVF